MKKRIMIIAFAVIAISLTMSLGAQGHATVYETVGELQSNTSKATAGVFTNDVDDYMNYSDYVDVLTGESKWFGFLSGNTIADGVLDIGYARKFGGIYLGTWFRGNIFRTSGTNPYVTKTVTPVYDDALEILTSRTDTSTYENLWYETTNNFEFLIGFSNMGVKVGFFESTSSNKNESSIRRPVSVTDYFDGRKDYTNITDKYSNSASHLKPYLGWGATFDVGKLTIKPFVDFSIAIHSDTLIEKYMSYTEINGVRQDVDKQVGSGWNNGYIEPQGAFGAWLDLPKKETTQLSVGLAYVIDAKITSNNADGLGSVDGNVIWESGLIDHETKYTDRTQTVTDMTFLVEEPTYMKHQIEPAFKITGEPAENFKLGFLAAIPIIIISESSDVYTTHIQKTAVKYSWDLPGYKQEQVTTRYTGTYYHAPTLTSYDLGKTETSTFDFGLFLALGASYQLIPGRFGINAGIAASPVTYSHTVVKKIPRSVESVNTVKVTQDDGSVTTNTKDVTIITQDDEIEVTDIWSQYISQLSGGFTFNFTPKVALDLAVSGGTFSDNTFNLDISNVNIIFTFKF